MPMDLTPDGRARRAGVVVREQRTTPLRPLVWEDSGGGSVVEEVAYRELEAELARLQAAILGEDVTGGPWLIRSSSPVAEFRAAGYLQEVNRRILHPLGLALAVTVSETGEETLGPIFDHRDDPEGVVFDAETLDTAKVDRVQAELAARSPTRVRALGFVVQGPGVAPRRTGPQQNRRKT